MTTTLPLFIWRWRALSPAPAVSSCGCFLPDLTRFTTLQCGGARRVHCKAFAPRFLLYHRCMEPADSIRRLGFARWYERRLIEGHAWFISGFICITAIAACMEELSFRGSIARLLLYVIVVAAAAAIGVYGLVRYQQILTLAGPVPQVRQRVVPYSARPTRVGDALLAERVGFEPTKRF